MRLQATQKSMGSLPRRQEQSRQGLAPKPHVYRLPASGFLLPQGSCGEAFGFPSRGRSRRGPAKAAAASLIFGDGRFELLPREVRPIDVDKYELGVGKLP